MKASEIRDLTTPEIEARLIEDQQLLQKMYFNHAISEIESPAKIRNMKRVIARMRTILTEREAAAAKENQNQ
ncbi:MAG: 50S ribosomal protein L29 [Bacteroidota bacterium]